MASAQRRPNFNRADEERLFQLYSEFKHIFEEKGGTSVINKKKKETWEQIAAKLNR